ncbi:hypothetical protein KY284_004934 [Solanum tuberosum]|nr:hypothetical protein KY284_004934 [Solanum tuberosum]
MTSLLIEQCQVAPPPHSGTTELTLSLTYFDHIWFGFGYIPGNIACPLNSSGYPELRYVTRDSVSVTFTETDLDFNHLISNHHRNAKDFYPFIPQLAQPKDALGVKLVPVLAIQGLLNKFGGDEQCLENEFIPFYDKSVVKDPYEQGTTICDEMKQNMSNMGDIIVTPSLDRVRADCRPRLNPPLPQSYFGNCLVMIASETSRVDLVGKEGFIIAVEVIGEAIKKQMKDVELILNCSWYREFCVVDMKRTLTIAGSPKFNLYDVDFGWGRPEKIEIISIDNSIGISMSISK